MAAPRFRPSAGAYNLRVYTVAFMQHVSQFQFHTYTNWEKHITLHITIHCENKKMVHVGKDQEKVQSEKDSHSKNRGGEKTKLTIRYLYHETHRKPNEQLFSR